MLEMTQTQNNPSYKTTQAQRHKTIQCTKNPKALNNLRHKMTQSTKRPKAQKVPQSKFSICIDSKYIQASTFCYGPSKNKYMRKSKRTYTLAFVEEYDYYTLKSPLYSHDILEADS
jgi:hypothetical protein